MYIQEFDMPKILQLPSDTINDKNDLLIIEDALTAKTKKIATDKLQYQSGNITSDSLLNNNFADGSILTGKIDKIDSSVIFPKYAQILASDLNPLPTASTLVPNSTHTFTIDYNAVMDVTFGCYMQNNSSSNAYLHFFYDNVQIRSCEYTNNSTAVFKYELGKRLMIAVNAGTHTIKLQAQCSATNTSVAIEPYIVYVLFGRQV
jgi:hypothetical protein